MSQRKPSRPPEGRWLIALIGLSLVAFLVWASWAEIDQIARAPGTVIPGSRNQVIQVMEQGMVDDIPVREGDFVRRGQVLVILDRVRAEAAYMETRAKMVALKAAIARLTGEMLNREPEFPEEVADYPEIQVNQLILFQRRKSALHEELAAQSEMLRLVNAELNLMQPLVASGDVSRVEVLRLQRQSAEIQGRLATRKSKYLEDTQAELAKAQETLETVNQQLTQQRRLLEHTEIVSPMDGVVRNIRITTRGGVARSGEEIMQIVPVDDELIVEAKVRPADIAFVQMGLPASVKFDAWDFSIFGSFSGVVSFISADTLNEEGRLAHEEPYYRVHVRLVEHDLAGKGLKPIIIQPGMTATVEIKTGNNTVLKYITKPLIKTLHGAFSEH